MKCSKCGAEIKSGSVFCENCGKEVQIVPDYNPLDEVLTEQVKSEIRFEDSNKKNQDKATDITEKPVKGDKNRKNKRGRIAAAVLAGAAVFGVSIFFIYQNSYTGQLQKGYASLEKEQYKAAYQCFETAMKKDPKREEAYIAMAQVYMKHHMPVMAEEILFEGIENITESVKIYKALAEYYIEEDREEEIHILLSGCDENLLNNELKEYYTPEPKFSKKAGEYEEIVKLNLHAKGCKIYYTLDGSSPTGKGKIEYKGPIQLEDGKWTVRAVAVNENGIQGPECEKEYIVDVPLLSAPMVSPSSNLYEEKKKIVVSVPFGYTAYYTFDGTLPDADSKQYKGPINMPVGNTIFMAVLIDENGRVSDVAIRNYDLHMNP